MNFPGWVTDDTQIPTEFLVRAKKLIYTFVAIEKLRILHNAGWKWCRGEALTPVEEALLAEAFPGLWPTPPTEEQVRNWIETYWEPRHHELQGVRCVHRRAVNQSEFSYVDLDDII